MKNFRVVARVVNNQMRERREALGITQTEVARRAGIAQGIYCNLENLKESAIDRRPCRLGKWTPTAIKIAAVLDAPPETLWPEEVRTVRARLVERRLNAEEFHALACPPPDPSPLGLLTTGEEVAAIRAAVDALPEQQRIVLTARFGLDGEEPRMLGEIADELKVSKSRVQQVEATVLRKLRDALGRSETE